MLRYKNGRGNYKNKKQREIIECLYCKTSIEVIKDSKRKYCSNKCQREFTINTAIQSGSYTKSNAFSWFKKNTEYKCNCCGIFEWCGNHITLQIDHIDGNNKNNIVENLRYLCPNCHTQTDTWGFRNISQDGYARMVASNRRNGGSHKNIGL